MLALNNNEKFQECPTCVNDDRCSEIGQVFSDGECRGVGVIKPYSSNSGIEQCPPHMKGLC